MAPGLRDEGAGRRAPGFADDRPVVSARRRPLPVREGAGISSRRPAPARGLATVGLAEAYRHRHDRSAFLTTDELAMARAAARLLADASARRMLGTRARALAERALSFEHGVRVLDGSLLCEPG